MNIEREPNKLRFSTIVNNENSKFCLVKKEITIVQLFNIDADLLLFITFIYNL